MSKRKEEVMWMAIGPYSAKVDPELVEVKALREKLANKDKAEAALRREVNKNEGEAAALRREVKALHEKVEAAEKASREKEQELEGAYRTFRKMAGMSATPQRAPESDKSQQDCRRPDTPITPPGRSYPGGRGGDPYVDWNPQTRADEAWEEHVKRVSGGDHHGEWDSGK
jgi:seryl-tRNA synthetase